MISKENFYLPKNSNEYKVDWDNYEQKMSFVYMRTYLEIQTKGEREGVSVPELVGFNDDLRRVANGVILKNMSSLKLTDHDLWLMGIEEDKVKENKINKRRKIRPDLSQKDLFKMSLEYLMFQTSYEVNGNLIPGLKEVHNDMRMIVEKIILNNDLKEEIGDRNLLKMGIVDKLSNLGLIGMMGRNVNDKTEDINKIVSYFLGERKKN